MVAPSHPTSSVIPRPEGPWESVPQPFPLRTPKTSTTPVILSKRSASKDLRTEIKLRGYAASGRLPRAYLSCFGKKGTKEPTKGRR